MAYGFSLVDDYGVEQFTSDGVLYEHSRGTGDFIDMLKSATFSGSFPTSPAKHSINGAVEPGYWRFWYFQRPYQRLGSSNVYSHDIVDTGTSTTYTSSDQGTHVNYWGNNIFVANSSYITGSAKAVASYTNESFLYESIDGTSDNTNYYWDLFWKLPSTGAHGLNTFYQPYTYPYSSSNPSGTNGYFMPRLGTGDYHEWVLASTKKPAKTSAYGFECYDASGNTIYSSGYQKRPIPVHAFATFTATEVEDCVKNGTSYNRTLRKSITTPWIGGHIPYCYYRLASTDNLDVATITVSGSTCTLSRVRYTMSNLSDWGYTQFNYQDLRIVIADGI